MKLTAFQPYLPKQTSFPKPYIHRPATLHFFYKLTSVRPETLVRICDECNFGTYGGRCCVCGSPGISDAYYCAECTRLEKDRDGCPKIVNLGASRYVVSLDLDCRLAVKLIFMQNGHVLREEESTRLPEGLIIFMSRYCALSMSADVVTLCRLVRRIQPMTSFSAIPYGSRRSHYRLST
jgi:hypothetical protein